MLLVEVRVLCAVILFNSSIKNICCVEFFAGYRDIVRFVRSYRGVFF